MREIVTSIIYNWELVLLITILVVSIPFVLSRYFPNIRALLLVKRTLKVILTNRINLLIVFMTVYITTLISLVLHDSHSLGSALFGALYLVLGYGMMFWIGFILLIIGLDIILFSFHARFKYINIKLILECTIISIPFIYWGMKHSQPQFLVAVIAFLIGQMFRKFMLLKILLR
jgi:hypothetical protein